MDAIKLLKDDHKKVKGLFREFESAGERAYQTKQRIVTTVIHELTIHSALEEEIFYPAVAAKGSKDEKAMVAEGLEEHHVVDVLMNELKGMDPQDEQYVAKFTVLIENVEHHIEEEEGEMLPDAPRKLGDDLERIGDQMLARKEQLMAAQPT